MVIDAITYHFEIFMGAGLGLLYGQMLGRVHK